MKRRTFFGAVLVALLSGKLVEKLANAKPEALDQKYLVGIDPHPPKIWIQDAGTWAYLAQDWQDPADMIISKRFNEAGEAVREMMCRSLFVK